VLAWDDLRFVLAAARKGTLAAAAEELRVDHTTVGRRLRALERALSARLFERRPDGLVPTAAGRCVLEAAEATEARVLALEHEVSGGDARAEGVVRIATSHTFATCFLVPALSEILARHPGVAAEVVTRPGGFDLPRRAADLALRFSRPEQVGLIARRVADIGFGAYASKDYLARRGRPARAGDLAGHDVVGYDPDAGFIPGGKWLSRASAGARVVLKCDQILSALAASAAGLGVTVLPCFVGDSEPTVERLGNEVVEREPLWLVVHPDLLNATRVRLVVDMLNQIFERDRRRLGGKL
jgi:DNA-binding transcriptional LysR family regulator